MTSFRWPSLIGSKTAAPPRQPVGGGIDTRIVVEDVDAMYRRATGNDVTIVHDIADRDYGLRDFIIRDPVGFRLRFAMRLSPVS